MGYLVSGSENPQHIPNMLSRPFKRPMWKGSQIHDSRLVCHCVIWRASPLVSRVRIPVKASDRPVTEGSFCSLSGECIYNTSKSNCKISSYNPFQLKNP